MTNTSATPPVKRRARKPGTSGSPKSIDILREVVRFDHLYVGGGNAKDITFPLPPDVTIVPNTDGLTGGIRLWRKDPTAYAAADAPRSDAVDSVPESGPAPA